MTGDGGPGVLIISDRWGSPFQGGIPAAIRLLARLFHSIGLSVKCTVLNMTETEESEAKDLKIKPIFPKPRGSLKHTKPNKNWLLAHESHFRNLKELSNIDLVICFALATSEAGLAIRDDIFPSAKYCVTNLWPSDDESLSRIIGCDKQMLEDLIEMLEEEQHNSSSVIVSIDHQTFQYYSVRLEAQNHFQILPAPDEKMFTFKLPKMLPEGKQVYQIVSCLEEHDTDLMTNQKQLAEAINIVAENFHSTQKTPPTWVLNGVTEAMEDKVKQILKPHTHLKIIPSNKQSSAFLKKVLRLSHLVLIPPNSPGMNSLHLLISTIDIGIPLLVSLYSPCHDLIKEYFPEYVDDMVVDMTDPQLLAQKIQHVISNYEASIIKAAERKERLQSVVSKSINGINKRFTSNFTAEESALPQKDRHDHGPQIETPVDAGNPSHGMEDSGNENDSHHQNNMTPSGQIKLHVNISGIPLSKCSMAQVTRAYRLLQEVIEDTPRQLEAIHRDITVEGTSSGSVIYHLKCRTLDSLNCLWHQYQTLKLKKMITSTTISDRTLKKIGALYLDIRPSVDAEEYEKCKEVLTQLEEQSQLLLLEVDPAMEIKSSTETSVQTMFKAEKCIRLKGRQCDMLQVLTTNTDTVQHILSCRQDVLALLGVTRYHLTDAATQDMDTQELEDQLLHKGTTVLPIDDEVTLLGRSLLPFQFSDIQVTQYWVEHLLALGQTVTQSKLHLEMRILQGQLDEVRQERDTFKEQTRLLTQELERTESALTKQQVATDAMREIFHAELTETQKMLQQTEAKLSARETVIESENREKQITASESEDRDNSALHHSTISKDTGDESVQADDTSVSETKPTDVSDDMFVGMASDEQTTIHIDKEDYGGFASDHGASTGSVGTAAEGNWKMKLLEGHPSQPGHVFIKATGVAFHGDQLMVCYPDNHIIQILDKDYGFLRVIGSFTGQFTKPFRPLDVAITHSNLIFINERGNSQVVVCDESNTVVRVISPLKEVSIYGIALMLRYLLLTDVRGHRLLKYTQDGEYVSEVGSKGSGNTEFDWPWSVVVNSNNVIMVSDCHNHCIKCFDSSLQFLYKLGTPGSGDGQLDWPCSIAVDKDDNVYVCDSSNDRIVKWRSDGKWICNLFQGEVQNPLHIAVTADRIAITEVKSNTVKVFYL